MPHADNEAVAPAVIPVRAVIPRSTATRDLGDAPQNHRPSRPDSSVAALGRNDGKAAHLSSIAAGLLLLTGCIPPPGGQITTWCAEPGQEIGVDSPALPENEVYSASRGELSLDSAINETVSFQLVFRTDEALDETLNIHVSDFAGPQGNLDARSSVALFRAHYVPVEHFRSWYPDHARRPALPATFPDILVPWNAPKGGGPLRLEPGRNELVWVDLHVPPGTEPGEYVGEVEVLATRPSGIQPQRSVFRTALRLQVWPVAIPGPRSLPIICRVEPTDMLVEHMRWPRGQAEGIRLLPDSPSHAAPIAIVDATMQLLHAHRTTPVLWGSFPKYRPTLDARPDIDWEPYDRLVGRWVDGNAFPDRVALARWPMPVSLEHPDAETDGGFETPRYARLLSGYIEECKRHFDERGWLDRAFVRLNPPAAMSAEVVDRIRRAGRILRQSETGLGLVAHLPAESLRGLGWYGAPTIELRDVGVWAPPAMWFEPAIMQRERNLGRQTWFMPDAPPYSASLAVEAPATDARVLAWQAYRYDADAIWIEKATEFSGADGGSAALIYPGEPYGLLDRPVPSIRLKRLRRGQLDYELLRLLDKSGKRLLARTIAEQVVRWSFTDACLDHLLSCRETGWSIDPGLLRLARRLIVQELAGTFDPHAERTSGQLDALAQWSRVINRATRVHPALHGVRLAETPEGVRLRAFVSATNATGRDIRGRWTLADPPLGWRLTAPVVTQVVPGGRAPATVECALEGLAFNVQGVYPFMLRFDTEELGAFTLPTRLAVATCPVTDAAPTIDGELSDWLTASSNVAGDFRLCRGIRDTLLDERADAPALPTEASFSMDRQNLYVAIRCGLRGLRSSPDKPQWQADNVVPVDQIVPWEQDVVEILLDPRDAQVGTTGDLFVLQIKPNGLLVARHGARTDPPVGPSEDWRCGARTAVRVERDAWTVEVALPLASLPESARQTRIWGCNVTRLDARRGEYSSWSGTRGHCYAPQRLGNLVMEWP